MTKLSVYLLGPPRLELDRNKISVDTRKAIALLAYLAITGQTQSRSSLSAMFWPESDRHHARTALRRTLAAFNRAVGKQWLASDRSTIGIDPGPLDAGDLVVDALAFRRHVPGCAEHAPRGAAECDACFAGWEEAIRLYDGRFLEGFSLADSPDFDNWQSIEGELLRQELAGVMAHVVEAGRLRGRLMSATEHARRWVTLEPLQEEAHRALMTLYAERGERGAAIRQYDECRRMLRDEIGVEPDEETETLLRRIVQGGLESQPQPAGGPPVARRDSPPSIRPLRSRLPARATSFVGRDAEKREIHARLDDPEVRLVTIVGPGGIGKTRLALEVAHERVERPRHGVHLCSLADVAQPGLILAAIAATLDFTFAPGADRDQQLAQLLDYLREKELLLVLDNFEHLVEATDVLTAILGSAPAVTMLVTSQERLNLREEWLIELDGLLYPNGVARELEACSAVQLFVQRATQSCRDFTLDAEHAPHIVRICQLVDGLPLGIELAASWVRMFPPKEIAEQIEHSLDFLETTVRNVARRHRSLRAIFERSWEMLDEEERRALRRLSIFRSGFDVHAARVVAGASMPTLVALADKSLIRRGAPGRFDLPEVLRVYASEKLAAAPEPAVVEAHALYFAALLADNEPALKGARQTDALEVIQREVGNIRQALRWLVAAGRVEVIGQVLPAYVLLYEIQGWFDEGADEIERSVAHLESSGLADGPVRGCLAAAHAAFLARMSRFSEAEVSIERALTILREYEESHDLAYALMLRGVIAEATGDYDTARSVLEQGLEHYRALSDRWGLGNVLTALGNVATATRALDDARDYYEQSLEIRRAIDDRRGIALCYHNLGNIAQAASRFDEARRLYRESLAIKREIGDRRGVGYSLNNLGYLEILRGAYPEADRLLAEAHSLLRELGDRRGIAYVLMNRGNVAMGEAEYGLARVRYNESWRLFETIGDRVGIAYTLEDRGNAALALGDPARAAAHFRSAIGVASEVALTPVVHDAITGLAEAHAAAGEAEEAIHVLAVLLTDPALPEERRARVSARIDRLAQTLPADAVERIRGDARCRRPDELALGA